MKNEDVKMKTKQVLEQACYKDLNVNIDDLGQWVTHFKSEKRIIEQADLLKKLDHDLFTN